MITNKIVYCLFIITTAHEVLPQHTEANVAGTQSTNVFYATNKLITDDITEASTIKNEITTKLVKEIIPTEPNFFKKLYNNIVDAIRKFFANQRVKAVFHNVGTCMVNGAMEIVTYYFPAPMIPLIASAAGLLIPFEPVITLREKIPVTSYRRAFNKAVNSFMGTFDKYKEMDDDDPYMTRKFNRRFLNSPESPSRKDNSEESTKTRSAKNSFRK